MIKAIQTEYMSCNFRSRTEARWAIFFEKMGLRWEYEPEGFHLSDGRSYLPDFRVYGPTGLITYYEIKGAHGTDDGKIAQLGKDFQAAQVESICMTTRFSLLSGDPKLVLGNSPYDLVCPRCLNVYSKGDIEVSFPSLDDAHYACHPCDYSTGSGVGDWEEATLGLMVQPYKGWVILSKDSSAKFIRLTNFSLKSASSARFEHGETPR